jgi:acylphosphatase
MPVKVKLRIQGRVQGVFYRQSTQEVARRLGIGGWVRNLPDGSVEAEAHGDRACLEKLVEWCNRGPERARVDKVECQWLDFSDGSTEADFQISD